MRKITLFLVDDHALFRKGLKALIEQNKRLEVIAEAGNGEDALKMLQSLDPDIVLMDINLGGIDGIETMRRIYETKPETRVIILSATDYDDQVYECIVAGAAGYLLKNLEPDELFCTIDAVFKSGSSIHRARINQMLNAIKSKDIEESCQEDLLSMREKDVLKLVALGLTNKEIAENLNIAPNTVKAHISNIMTKLNMHNRVELASFAISIGLVNLS